MLSHKRYHQVSGNGDATAKIQLPLKGCGTVQSPTRVFTNNIVVRFHPGLEIDGDEVDWKPTFASFDKLLILGDHHHLQLP